MPFTDLATGQSSNTAVKPLTTIIVAALLSCKPFLSLGGVVEAWNSVAINTVCFANTPPPAASRQLAMLHVAIFDSINELGGFYQSYRPHTNAPVGALPEAAAAAAANQMLRQTWPHFTTTFDAELQAQLAALPDSPAKSAGVAWGRRVAQTILVERAFDGANYGVDYDPAPGPGRWVPTPPLFISALLPQWAGLKPFALDRPDQFRSAPPPGLSSPEWAEQINQVKLLGSKVSTARTPDQTQIAWFWAGGVGTDTPPGQWNGVAVQLAKTKGLSLLESARLFALLNLALADAGIACWDTKFAFDWWRPITAIRAADTDGNPATELDRGWAPLIVTPPFPEHVSGHSTFSAAAAAVLASVHGSDEFSFELTSRGLFGAIRRYDRFSTAAAEAGMSRIYGGIHFMAANLEGQKLGRAVGEHVIAQSLRPRITPAEETSGVARPILPAEPLVNSFTSQ